MRLRDELPGFAKRIDLTDTGSIAPALDEMLAHLGGVDALIHLAAIGSTLQPAAYDDVDEVDAAGWDRLMALNVKSAFFACQHLATRFGDESGGNIVLVGSVDGIKPVPAPVPYAASKAALRGMAQALSKALGPRKLRVNVVAPGVLERGVSHTLPDDIRAEYLKHCSAQRLGRLDEAAGLICWLALHNSYVTGQTVVVDGGL